MIAPTSQKALNQDNLNFQIKNPDQPDKKERCCSEKGFLIAIAIIFLVCTITLFVLIFVLLSPSRYIQTYDLIKLASSSALCLDGSPGSYYISRNGNPQKILIYFQGGGWSCSQDETTTLKHFFDRSRTFLGSSESLPSTKQLASGILAKDQNDIFRDWKKIFLNYCDGSVHQGYRRQPVEYQNTKLYLRGYNITVQNLQDLQKRIGLFTKATHIALSGGSAGGLATYIWTNYLAQRARNAKVYSVPDAGIFYDAVGKNNGKISYKQCLANMMKFSNVEIDPPVPECINKFPNAKQNCMFAQNLYQFIKPPLFVVQSVYDSWYINFILNIDCINNGMKTCNQEDRNLIEESRKNVTAVLNKIAENPQNGVWGLGCLRHGMLDGPEFISTKTTIPGYSQITVGFALTTWIKYPDQNNVHIDNAPWPRNKPCS